MSPGIGAGDRDIVVSTCHARQSQEFPILGARFKGDKYYTLVAWLRTAFRGRLILRGCVRCLRECSSWAGYRLPSIYRQAPVVSKSKRADARLARIRTLTC